MSEERYQAALAQLHGALVPVMPAFGEEGGVDLDATCRYLDTLIRQGVGLFWTTYGTSHFMCLSEAEILELTRAVAETAHGRAFFVASTGFWPAARCRDFIARAAEWGAGAVKVQIDWRWKPVDAAVLAFYREVGRDAALPLLAYTLGNPGGMSVGLLEQILELPAFVGMKNDSGDFYENCEYLAAVRRRGAHFAVLTGGSLASFLHGADFGMTAFATGLGMLAPQPALEFAAAMQRGERRRAVEIITQYEEPLSTLVKEIAFPHWSVYHTMLSLLGHFPSDQMRFPLARCDDATRRKVAAWMAPGGDMSRMAWLQ